MRNLYVELTSQFNNKDITTPCLFILNNNAIYHSGKMEEDTGKNKGLIFADQKNSYLINNIDFNSVKIFEHYPHISSSIYNPTSEKEVYYWAKNIGIIRVEKYNNNNDSLVSVKNLIRYNVKLYKQ